MLVPAVTLALALTLAALPQAAAQTAVSGSIGLVSDYRYRGQSLSDGAHGASQLTINLDHASGWYAGGFASNIRLAGSGGAKLMAYGGYAARLDAGASWEAGCTRNRYTRIHGADYSECYAGLAAERSGMRLYYSPDYLGSNRRTLYAELNGYYPLSEQLNLTGHAGLLRALSGPATPGIPDGQRYDLRLGLNLRLGNWNAQLARSWRPHDAPASPAPAAAYPASYPTPYSANYPAPAPTPAPGSTIPAPSSAWIVGLSYAF